MKKPIIWNLVFTWENQCRQTRHNAPKISQEEKWNCSCERRGAGRETRQGMQEAKYDFMTVSGVYSIVVTVRKQVVAHSVVNFVGSHNVYRCDDFLSIETLWSLPFNSHEWPRQNFSLQYKYNINQMSNENIEKYQFGENRLIQYQILRSNILRIVSLTVRRITNLTWELKG